jgi:hypothetical protein
VILASWHKEPISKKHHRDAFDRGEEALNDFLRRYARKSHDLAVRKPSLQLTTLIIRPFSASIA